MIVMAHRGYSGRYPENTMLAFQKAAETGCQYIELDVQKTKDGVVVVIHDEKTDRTTDRCGNVRDYTCEQLRELNASALYPDFARTEKIPTFEEYCKWAQGQKIRTNIELKTGVYYYEDLEKSTIEIIRAFGLTDRVIFSSFNHLSLIKAKELAPEIPCGALIGNKGMGNAGYYCKKYGFEYYHPGFGGLTDEIVANCKEYGVGINVWTVNQMAELEQAYAWGCEGVITNHPEICKAWLDHKGRVED